LTALLDIMMNNATIDRDRDRKEDEERSSTSMSSSMSMHELYQLKKYLHEFTPRGRREIEGSIGELEEQRSTIHVATRQEQGQEEEKEAEAEARARGGGAAVGVQAVGAATTGERPPDPGVVCATLTWLLLLIFLVHKFW
jgi:hypothetical protein